jgi:hypothetical protein
MDAIQTASIIVAVAAQRVEAAVGCRELVPFFASHLAGFAADADCSVRVKSHGFWHKSLLTSRISNSRSQIAKFLFEI